MNTNNLYYNTVVEKIKNDYYDNKRALNKIDADIKELQFKRSAMIKEGLLIDALYKAASQFDIENIVLNEIFSEDEVLHLSKIEHKLINILNVSALPDHTQKQLETVLKSGKFLSCGIKSYKINNTPSDFDDEADHD